MKRVVASPHPEVGKLQFRCKNFPHRDRQRMKLTLTGRIPTRNSFKLVLINQYLDDLAITGMG